MELDVPRLLPLSCLTAHKWDHFDSLISMSTAPFVIFAGGSALVRALARDRRQAQSRFNYYFARFMLLAYPTISRTICQSFRCKPFGGHLSSWLVG